MPSPATAVRTVPSPAPGDGAIVGLARVPLAAVFAGAFFRGAGAVPAGAASAVTVLAGLAAAALVRGARVPVAAVSSGCSLRLLPVLAVRRALRFLPVLGSFPGGRVVLGQGLRPSQPGS